MAVTAKGAMTGKAKAAFRWRVSRALAYEIRVSESIIAWAKATGRHRNSVSAWRRGVWPSYPTCIKLCPILGLNPLTGRPATGRTIEKVVKEMEEAKAHARPS